MDTCACPRSFVYINVYGILKKKQNTTMKFHTFDVVVGNGGVFCTYGAGRAIWLLYGFHYLFISYLFVSPPPYVEV